MPEIKEDGNFMRTERSTVRAMCGVQLDFVPTTCYSLTSPIY